MPLLMPRPHEISAAGGILPTKASTSRRLAGKRPLSRTVAIWAQFAKSRIQWHPLPNIRRLSIVFDTLDSTLESALVQTRSQSKRLPQGEIAMAHHVRRLPGALCRAPASGQWKCGLGEPGAGPRKILLFVVRTYYDEPKSCSIRSSYDAGPVSVGHVLAGEKPHLNLIRPAFRLSSNSRTGLNFADFFVISAKFR
jgi:hypothetical protein